MRRLILALLLALSLAGCKKNPYTGRRQLLVLSEEQEIEMGQEAYAEMTGPGSGTDLVTDPRYLEPLLRVGNAIARAAESHPKFANQKFEWEFRLINDPKTVNAWALPGGKIAFYTGIYPILQDENGMAIVMGHEVSHALLRHSGERVSQNVLVQSGLTLADVMLEDNENHDAYLAALGLGAQVGFALPYSRKHETEADKFGLELAARAGYDPEAAIGVWTRMAELGGSRAPEILSTHPDPLRRVENMREWMPRVKKLYQRADPMPNEPLPPIR